MMKFNFPFNDVEQQNMFKEGEVGLNHPDVEGFVRIRNNGDVEIVAADGLAIVMNPLSRSITFVADHIKFMTKHEEGLRWNRLSFNDKATNFTEPSLIETDDVREGFGIYSGVDHYTPDPKKKERSVKDDLDDAARQAEE